MSSTPVCSGSSISRNSSRRLKRLACAALGLAASLLAGCGTSSSTKSTPPAALNIVTKSLPNGQASTAYSANLTATGVTAPYTWTLTNGTLPAGLSLAANGVITGTPTSVTDAAPLTVSVKDSGDPAQTATAQLTLTIAVASLAV